MRHYTRFRAYQLGECGASFSLSVDNHFTLIEARYNQTNKPHILWEIKLLNKNTIDTLHITSWDDDHCKSDELINILRELLPTRIEYPSYTPHTDNGRVSLTIIEKYKRHINCELIPITPAFVLSKERYKLQGIDIFYNPVKLFDKSNDNSVVKLFRVGSFQILSLGDCESAEIRDRLMADEILRNEVDVLILAHHGADNGFTTTEILKALSPTVAICASDYNNQYGHPDDAVVNRLRSANIDYYSTKRGDIIVKSVDKYQFEVTNYFGNNKKKDAVKSYLNKTFYVAD